MHCSVAGRFAWILLKIAERSVEFVKFRRKVKFTSLPLRSVLKSIISVKIRARLQFFVMSSAQQNEDNNENEIFGSDWNSAGSLFWLWFRQIITSSLLIISVESEILNEALFSSSYCNCGGSNRFSAEVFQYLVFAVLSSARFSPSILTFRLFPVKIRARLQFFYLRRLKRLANQNELKKFCAIFCKF